MLTQSEWTALEKQLKDNVVRKALNIQQAHCRQLQNTHLEPVELFALLRAKVARKVAADAAAADAAAADAVVAMKRAAVAKKLDQ